MSTVQTAYGLLDKDALLQLQSEFDTRRLLAVVDDLDRLTASWKGNEGLRESVLRLHSMAHTVVNGAGMSASVGRESLPELASDVAGDLRGAISALQRWIEIIEPLETLQLRN